MAFCLYSGNILGHLPGKISTRTGSQSLWLYSGQEVNQGPEYGNHETSPEVEVREAGRLSLGFFSFTHSLVSLTTNVQNRATFREGNTQRCLWEARSSIAEVCRLCLGIESSEIELKAIWFQLLLHCNSSREDPDLLEKGRGSRPRIGGWVQR